MLGKTQEEHLGNQREITRKERKWVKNQASSHDFYSIHLLFCRRQRSFVALQTRPHHVRHSQEIISTKLKEQLIYQVIYKQLSLFVWIILFQKRMMTSSDGSEDDLMLFLEAVKEVNEGEQTEFFKSELEVRKKKRRNEKKDEEDDGITRKRRSSFLINE